MPWCLTLNPPVYCITILLAADGSTWVSLILSSGIRPLNWWCCGLDNSEEYICLISLPDSAYTRWLAFSVFCLSPSFWHSEFNSCISQTSCSVKLFWSFLMAWGIGLLSCYYYSTSCKGLPRWRSLPWGASSSLSAMHIREKAMNADVSMLQRLGKQ